MTTLRYRDDETLREARLRYWRANGFGDDGGYSKKWEVLKIGPLPFPIPNGAARKDAIRYHDLNHVITGYDTDLSGETEIAAWEVASGCGTKWVAWLLNLQALLMSPAWPKRTLRAWARGRRSKNLYSDGFTEETLDQTVGELRDRLNVPPPETEPEASDRVSLVATVTATILVNLLLIAAGITGILYAVQKLTACPYC